MLEECHCFAESARAFRESGDCARRVISSIAAFADWTFAAAFSRSSVWHTLRKFVMFGPYTIATPSAAQSIGVCPPTFGGRLLPINAKSAICVRVLSSPVVSARYTRVPSGACFERLRTLWGISFKRGIIFSRRSAWRGTNRSLQSIFF